MERENKRSRVPGSLVAIAIGIVTLVTVAVIVAVAVLAVAGGGSSEGDAAISSGEITKVPAPGRNPALLVPPAAPRAVPDHGIPDVTIARDNAHEHDADVVDMTLNVVEGRRWSFEPAVFEVSVGERVMLTLVNDGRAVHDVEITGVPAEEIEVVSGETHAAAGGGHHDEAVVAAHASPGTTATVLFTPTEAGEYEFAYTIPGHKEAGMFGKLIVTL